MGGHRTYGWTADGKEVVAREAAELRRAAREYDAGESLKRIVEEMNYRGVPTARAQSWDSSPAAELRRAAARAAESGKTLAEIMKELADQQEDPIIPDLQWAVTALARMLKHPRMIGRNADSLGRPIMQGPPVCPPVFETEADVALWRRVRAKLTDPTRKRSQHIALLNDHIVCGACGSRMYPTRPARREPRYVCREWSGWPGCGRMSVQAKMAEEFVGLEAVCEAADVVPGLTVMSAATWWAAADLDAHQELLAGLLDTVAVHSVSQGRVGTDRLVLTWKDMPSWPASLAALAGPGSPDD